MLAACALDDPHPDAEAMPRPNLGGRHDVSTRPILPVPVAPRREQTCQSRRVFFDASCSGRHPTAAAAGDGLRRSIGGCTRGVMLREDDVLDCNAALYASSRHKIAWSSAAFPDFTHSSCQWVVIPLSANDLRGFLFSRGATMTECRRCRTHQQLRNDAPQARPGSIF